MSLIQGILLGVVAAIIAMLGLGLYMQHITINDLRASNATALTQVTNCEAANANWKITSDTQNKAIAEMAKEANAKKTASEKTQELARVARNNLDGKADILLNQSENNSDDCASAKAVLGIYLKGLAKK